MDAPAIKNEGSLDVDWSMLFAICRGQEREIEELKERLDELEAAMS